MTRSGEPVPSWDENWRLLRQLWPSWEPTPEIIRHVWFLAYDKPNAPEGLGFIDHESLRRAIVEHARSARWKEPEFLAISKLYNQLKNEKMTTRAKAATKTRRDAEWLDVQKEHERRIGRIEQWDQDRLESARTRVAGRFASFRSYTRNIAEWSPIYSGLITAADEEIREELNGATIPVEDASAEL